MEVSPDRLIESHPNIKEILSTSDRINTAAIFGAMLLDKRLQSNCLRLEALVHVAVAIGSGASLPTQKQLAHCFNDLDEGVCGRMEDPAEDVFVSLVTTSVGNFRVLEGIWESGTFYLQQILAIVQRFPDEGAFAVLRQRVLALLTLSEAICNRANLCRYSAGDATPKSRIAPDLCSKANRRLVFFDSDDLEQLGLTRGDLDIFTFDDQLLPRLLTEPISNSPLQRFPVLTAGDRLALVLPTAVSFAIRTAVVDFLIANGFHEAFQANLAHHYAVLLRNMQLLGSIRGTPLVFSAQDGLPIAEAMTDVDKGRYLHLLFFLDTLDRFHDTGLAGTNPQPAEHAALFESRMRSAIAYAARQPHYRGGVTLLVHCGIGRGVSLSFPHIESKDWTIQFLSLPDLYTLSWTSKFSALKFWKSLEGVQRLEDLGVEIWNHNGLLNLIAWIDANEGHLVTHSQVPRGFRGSHGSLMIAPNFVLDLRHRVAIENDAHGLPTVDGHIALVRRVKDSFFPEDNDVPLYAMDRFSAQKGLPFVLVTGPRLWWCNVIPSADRVGDYDRWLMLKTWLPRIIRVVEPVVGGGLRDVVLLRVEFAKQTADRREAPVPTRDVIERSYAISVDATASTVTVSMGEEFELGLGHPTNLSERVLVVAICDAFARLANVPLAGPSLRGMELDIVPSNDARHLHVFQSRKYRDYVHGDLDRDFVEIDERDVADLRIGLAFRVESRPKGRASIRSKRQCTRLLNAIIRDLENEMCSDLRQFERASFVELSLRNHEKAIIDRERWTRTARANLALHEDEQAAMDVIADHDMKLNAVVLPSRVLIEFALCECATSGGVHAGHMDLSKLMAKANAMWKLGGWSDAIHLDAMPPTLTITEWHCHVPTCFRYIVCAIRRGATRGVFASAGNHACAV